MKKTDVGEAPLKAFFFEERNTNIEGIVFDHAPGRARYRVFRDAVVLGLHPYFPDISVKRAKEYDGATVGGQPVEALCYDESKLEKRSTHGKV